MYRPAGSPRTPDQQWLATELRAIESAMSKMQRAPSVIPLTDAATISVNAGRGADNFRVVLAGNRTLANPTGLVNGQQLTFRIKQDGTAGRTLAYGTKYKFAGGAAPVVTATADALSILVFQYDSADDTLGCIAAILDVR